VTGNMNLTAQQQQSLGQELYQALNTGRTIAPLTERYGDISIDDAYHISQAMLAARKDDRAVQVIGKKIGVTSKPVQDMLGVFQPDFGFLTADMMVENNVSVKIKGQLIQPRAEAEIAFLLKDTLQGPGVTEAQVLAATDCIMPCFEIVDSRIDNWNIKIQDTIADNASCGVFTIGDERLDPNTLDLPKLTVNVYKNGEHLSRGTGAEVQGNPLSAVAWLANTLGEFGIDLKAGEIILSGSLVPLEPVVAGDKMHMVLEGLGSCTIMFK